jgi:flagellar basal body-associated protein FliL
MVRDLELANKMNAESPSPENAEAKSIVLEALSSMTEEDIFDNEARLILRQDITERLNERIRPKPSTDKKAPPRPSRPFKDVLITEWAVQR